ncbi:MAG: 23S rRNA (uracil(1939)-C(5))-methyltransferase RlmD, partial [Sphaerochaetaceae bacterium]|nr:23S rRNA (uracil(1939)-C(5))-methyltransferase RlmD [Sphaerochaetaceae bacterium]
MAKQCPKAGSCGACHYNGVKYSKQLKEKEEIVKSLIGSFGPVAPIVGMENPFYYRNKVQAVFGIGPKGDVIKGIYRLGTHKLIPIKDCMLEDQEADSVLETVKNLVKRYGLSIYDEDLRAGFLRHVLVKRAFATNQTMVVLVTGHSSFPQHKSFIRDLVLSHQSIRTVLLNVNNEKTSMVLSENPCKVLYGDGYIEEELCNLKFRISAKSFFQVNPTQARKLYNIAIRMAKLTGQEEVIDAYCGTGTIGLIAAANGAKNVIGIELNPQAVEDAKENALLNNINNASFVCGDSSDVLKEMAKAKKLVDVVFLDPPRSGSDEKFLASVIKLSPKTIVYVSCNPVTLARDLRYLTSFGPYYMYGAQPVDMFPQTDSIETVVLLRDKRVDG